MTPQPANMGGVAGHAGLFSTADDLARFAQMMLNRGELDGARLFDPFTVERFTEPQSPPDQPILRGLGWDIDSPLSRQSWRTLPHRIVRTYWLHRHVNVDRPFRQTYVILLANSVHPSQRPALSPLRSQVATIVAASVGIEAPSAAIPATTNAATTPPDATRNATTQTGLDVLVSQPLRAAARQAGRPDHQPDWPR